MENKKGRVVGQEHRGERKNRKEVEKWERKKKKNERKKGKKEKRKKKEVRNGKKIWKKMISYQRKTGMYIGRKG